MEARFQNLPFRVSTLDGRNFVLLADVYYTSAEGTRYCLPAGATSDGASTPPELWPLIPPFGLYWPAAYLHDTAYRDTLLVWNGTAWVKAALPKDRCDSLLRQAMGALGVGELEREAIFEGVVLAGASSFNEDRGNIEQPNVGLASTFNAQHPMGTPGEGTGPTNGTNGTEGGSDSGTLTRCRHAATVGGGP